MEEDTALLTGSDNTSHGLKNDAVQLQDHIGFWDPDNDGIIYPMDVYRGFRDLGFSIAYSICSLFIPLLFSYITRPGQPHNTTRDLRFPICMKHIDKAIHSSDSSVFDSDGHFHKDKFDDMFDRVDTSKQGVLTTYQFIRLWRSNCSRLDPGGWLYSFMEMLTTFLLIQRRGKIFKQDLLGCYDGSIFFKIKEQRQMEKRDNGPGRRPYRFAKGSKS